MEKLVEFYAELGVSPAVYEYGEKAIAALREAQRQAGKVIWLNPIPERHWKHIRSVQTFASLCSMVCCSTLQSLAAACRRLTAN